MPNLANPDAVANPNKLLRMQYEDQADDADRKARWCHLHGYQDRGRFYREIARRCRAKEELLR